MDLMFSLCHPRFIILLRFLLPALILIFSVLAKSLAGKSVSDMTYLLSSGTLSHNSIGCRVSGLPSSVFVLSVCLLVIAVNSGEMLTCLRCCFG